MVDNTWIKNYVNNFDVTMGSLDSTQIADLVGICIFEKLNRILNFNQIGSYKDYRLIFILNSNDPKHLNCKRKILGHLDH